MMLECKTSALDKRIMEKKIRSVRVANSIFQRDHNNASARSTCRSNLREMHLLTDERDT